MTYEEALAYLRTFPDWERGTAANEETYTLDRMRRLLELLDYPDRAYDIVHVVGTKGKGSTSAMIAACLHAAGYRTGLFISPHLVDFRERIRVDNALIAPHALARIVSERLRPAVAHLPRAGERTPLHFELQCALAFEYFRQSGVDAAVVEAGLGGRLDATNAVASTALTAITTIGHDHMAVLGDTLEAIAGEKAAVVRPRGTVVSAPQQPEALAVIEEVCAAQEARLQVVGREWSVIVTEESFDGTTFDLSGPDTALEGLRTPLAGAHQAINGGVAVVALHALAPRYPRLDAGAIRRGLAATSWPGRLQIVARDPLVLVDAAHNRESAAALAAALSRMSPAQPYILVVAVFGDKDADTILRPLLPLASHVVVTAVDHPRALPAAELARVARALGALVEEAPTVAGALRRARTLASPSGRVLATGSLRTVGEVMGELSAIGAQPPAYRRGMESPGGGGRTDVDG